jgi:ABC-2 type transport system permease protein
MIQEEAPVNFLRIKAIAKKEFIQVARDPRSLGMAFAIPILLLILFGDAITMDVDHVPLAVWDQSKSQQSLEYILNFRSSPYFNIVAYVNSYAQMERAIDRNKALMGLVIPPDFTKRLTPDKSAAVQLLLDGSDSNTASIALGYATAVNTGYNKKLLQDASIDRGLSVIEPLSVHTRVWFNPDLKSRNYIIPGLIAVIMMVIASLLTSLTVAREWERGTMEQLISTPITSQELIIGKFVPYFVIGFVDMLIAVAMGEFIFHVPLKGSVTLLFALSGLFLTGALSLGMLISILTKNQLMANQMAIIVTFLPAFLLSGFAYSIANMPKPVQVLTHIIPARYFVTILKGIYLKGTGLSVLGMQVVYLAIFSAVTIAVANKKFKKTIE